MKEAIAIHSTKHLIYILLQKHRKKMKLYQN